MATPRQLLEAYLLAIGAGELEQARQCLADQRFRYVSPIGSFDDADRLIESLFGIAPILQQLDLRKCMSDEQEVLGIVDVRTSMQNYATRSVAFWCRVENDRIRSMEVIFDASEYRRMFADQFRTQNRD